MKEELNNLLLDELDEAHGLFDNIIKEMQSRNISYPYEKVIEMEENSFHISYNAISKLGEIYEKYNYIKEENEEYFSGEKKIFVKYIFLYIVSIIFIKVFSKSLSIAKINEIWFAIVGIVLGSTNAAIIFKNLNNYRNGTKEKRELNNQLMNLKEEYDQNYDIATREINYMFSLNRNLLSEIDSLPNKKVLKK